MDSPSGTNGPNIPDPRIPATLPHGVSIAKDVVGRYVVDIDIGGTNTDAIISRKNEVIYLKVDTTPHDLRECFNNVLIKGASRLGISNVRAFLRKTQIVRLSTSLSTNALVERKGGRIGMLLSKGRRPAFLDQFNHFQAGSSLVASEIVAEIDPRLLDENIRKNAYRLLTEGATSLVISLDAGADFPKAEQQVKSIINRYFAVHYIGSIPILLCSQLSRDRDYYKRTNTALLNAYTYTSLSRHLLGIEDLLRDMGYPYPLLIVHANGGSARAAKSTAIQTLSSGAAAGVYGACKFFQHQENAHIVITDVGGTSTEIGLIQQGTIAYSKPSHIGALPIDAPSAVYATIGIGGGSIARISKEGTLIFGPDSAGAFPGPACYNIGGTQPTLTDAYLILGYFDENDFLGGQKRIKKDIARKIINSKIAVPLGITCENAALLIKEKAVEIIGNRIRTAILSTNRPGSVFSIVAVGGGGGCIGADLSDFAGIGETHVIRQGAVFGAFGSSGMDIMHQYIDRVYIPWEKGNVFWKKISQKLNDIVFALQRVAAKDMAGEGFTPEGIHYEVELELELIPSGKMSRLRLPSPFLWLNKKQKNDIEERIEALFFHASTEATSGELSLSGVLLNALGRIPHAQTALHRKRATLKKTKKERRRQIYTSPGCWREAQVYTWDALSMPQVIEGPALIESEETTVFLPGGKRLEFDECGNGVMKGSTVL